MCLLKPGRHIDWIWAVFKACTCTDLMSAKHIMYVRTYFQLKLYFIPLVVCLIQKCCTLQIIGNLLLPAFVSVNKNVVWTQSVFIGCVTYIRTYASCVFCVEDVIIHTIHMYICNCLTVRSVLVCTQCTYILVSTLSTLNIQTYVHTLSTQCIVKPL